MESILSDTWLHFQRLDDLEVTGEQGDGGDHQVVNENIVAVCGHRDGRKTKTGQKMVSRSGLGLAMTALERPGGWMTIMADPADAD